MERFVQTLVVVIEANQRFLLRRAALQLLMLIVLGAGLWELSGPWWWLSLALFLLFLLAAVLGVFQLKVHLTMKLEPPWRAIGLGPPVGRSKERVLELHLAQGGVALVAVRSDLVEGVLSAAREAGLEVITEPDALRKLNATSARLERLHDLEALVPHVPTPALREEITATLSRVRDLEGCDELLRELEVQLLAEKSAQTTTSLRGPKPVFERELREKLARLTSPHRERGALGPKGEGES